MTNDKRILVVDDEEDIRCGVKRWLTARGYQTLDACDGNSGFKTALECTPSAIILDVLMPGKDGMETLAELQANQLTHDIPVVMLSASLRDEQRALDAGATYFVLKPYDGPKLVSTVTAAVNSSKYD